MEREGERERERRRRCVGTFIRTVAWCCTLSRKETVPGRLFLPGHDFEGKRSNKNGPGAFVGLGRRRPVLSSLLLPSLSSLPVRDFFFSLSLPPTAATENGLFEARRPIWKSRLTASSSFEIILRSNRLINVSNLIIIAIEF